METSRYVKDHHSARTHYSGVVLASWYFLFVSILVCSLEASCCPFGKKNPAQSNSAYKIPKPPTLTRPHTRSPINLVEVNLTSQGLSCHSLLCGGSVVYHIWSPFSLLVLHASSLQYIYDEPDDFCWSLDEWKYLLVIQIIVQVFLLDNVRQ